MMVNGHKTASLNPISRSIEAKIKQMWEATKRGEGAEQVNFDELIGLKDDLIEALKAEIELLQTENEQLRHKISN